jgi:hypothetical protein
MEELCFHPDLMELHDLPSFNSVKICPPKKAQIRREKTKEDLRPFLTVSGTSQRAQLTRTKS